MRAAVSDRRIVFNLCQDVPLPAEHHGEQRFLSATEVEVLADLIEPRFRALVLLAAYGGLRFGELAGLRRARVDTLRSCVAVVETLIEANGQLTFGPPKTKRSRRAVPLPRRVMRELEGHLDRYALSAPDSLVFSGPKGAPLRQSGIPAVMVEACGGNCGSFRPLFSRLYARPLRAPVRGSQGRDSRPLGRAPDRLSSSGTRATHWVQYLGDTRVRVKRH